MSHERVEGGFNTEDAITVSKLLQKNGVDAIDVVSGSAFAHEWSAAAIYMPAGYNTDISEVLRREVSIPISVAGKINDPYLAEEILSDGKADFVDIGRGVLADPQFVIKTMQGRTAEIRRCIGCLKCGDQILITPGPVMCTVNPAAGREKEFESKLKAVEAKKRVLIIGGGAAGMEAAIIAGQKGHDITLWEKSDTLGGQLNLAVIPSGKSEMALFRDYLKGELKKSGVRVELEKEATAASIMEFSPDAVVVAVGATPFVVDIPGVTGENVVGYWDVLSGERETGRKVVVWGAGLVGCEVAYFLAEKGKEVTQVFPEMEAAPDVLSPDLRILLVKKLEANKVKTKAGVKEFKEITSRGISLIDKEGRDVFIEADNIVLATGARSDITLARSLKGKVSNLYEAGDCVEPRRLFEAVSEGAEAGLAM
jgi:NADPH-dependent 2,4-dienoyl-CoA reductase/sulfur reductase-like enzyme